VSNQKRPGLKDVIESEAALRESPSRSPGIPTLTTRQTVANPKGLASTKPATRPESSALQQRSVSENKTMAIAGTRGKGQANSVSHFSNSKPIPQSIHHQPAVDPAWGLSMSEIVAQQELEKNAIKEAAAKRDLQEIQAEQEFQEWWEKESARVQEAEQRSSAVATKASKRNRGRGGRSARGGKGTGGKALAHDSAANSGDANTAASSAAKHAP
jgi:hypothetical protein